MLSLFFIMQKASWIKIGIAVSNLEFLHKARSGLDLVQGPFLVHYESMRAFPSRRVQNPACYKMHSFIVSKKPQSRDL